MKIWILQTGEYLPTDENKGRPMRAMNLSDFFIKNGHSITLLSSDFSHQYKIHRTKTFSSIKINKNYKLILIPSIGYQTNISLKRILDHFILGLNTFKYLIKIKKSDYPDFVFIGYPPIETCFFLTIWLKINKIPFCIDVKDQWPHIFLLKSRGYIRKILKLILLPYFYAAKYSLYRADFLTAITPKFLNWSENFSNNYSKNNQTLYLVPNIQEISEEKLHENLSWWQKKVGIDITQKNKIIFAGNINNAYDFDNLTLALLNPKLEKFNFEVVICGEGDRKIELEEKLNHKKNIFFSGWIHYEKLLALKKLSIATLAPYRNTFDFQMSIPNKIIDSLFFGLPIITSLTGEVENLIKEYNVGYFCNEKFTWTDQIENCLNDPKNRMIISNNAKILYRKKFTSELVYGKFVEFVERNYYKKRAEKKSC